MIITEVHLSDLHLQYGVGDDEEIIVLYSIAVSTDSNSLLY